MNKRPRKSAHRAPTGEPLVFTLLGTAGSVEARLEAVLIPLGLSLAKVALLEHLAKAQEPLALSQLATYQHCVRSNITQLVDRLEKDGLVRRRPDRGDRRSVRAELTPAGVRAHAQGVRALTDAQRAIMSALSVRDAASLKSALETLGS